MTPGAEWDARLSAWVAARRAAQGLPEKVENPDVIDAVAEIFRDARRARAHNLPSKTSTDSPQH